MTETIFPLGGYVLLNSNLRKSLLQKYKFSLISLTLCLGLLFVCILYLLNIGIGYRIIYPSDIAPEDVPISWIKRAIAYNALDKAEYNGEDFIKLKPNLDLIDKYKLICYYNFPSDSNATYDYLNPEDIDPYLCTHINVCFGNIVNDTIHIPDSQIAFVESMINLKEKNKDLKILLSIGGATDDDGFPDMVLNHQNRKKFIQSIDKIIREYKFDGIDIDWEFPNQNQKGDKRQKIHFMQLLQEIRRNINKQEKHKYILSVAVAAPTFLVDTSYDVARMNKLYHVLNNMYNTDQIRFYYVYFSYVDYINLMSYDYHFYTQSTPFTGINAPLYASPKQIGYFSTLNINYSAYYWHFNGMEKNKIIIGLPTYGHSYTLMNNQNTVIGAPASGYGRLGILGFADYKQVCGFVTENKIKPFFDMDSKSPYAVKYSEWVSYDDTVSLTFKTEFIKNNDFGGAMIFSLNMDDHIGVCRRDIPKESPKKFPLTNTVKNILTIDQM